LLLESDLTILLWETAWINQRRGPSLLRQRQGLCEQGLASHGLAQAAIALASVAPDLDGIGIIPEILSARSNHPVLWYSLYHHVLCHNLAFGMVLVVVALVIGARGWLTTTLLLISFHLHLAADLVGSRGPDAYQWPIRYLYPFSNSWELTWNGQWELNSWPNYLVTMVALAIVFTLAWRRGYSPLGLISERADQAFVRTLRRRWPSESQRQP
jgi:membrane-bound metal-dependent hydrolase YbcI (DUF457 family)